MILNCKKCGRKLDSNTISKDNELTQLCNICLYIKCPECKSKDVEVGFKVASCGACGHKWDFK